MSAHMLWKGLKNMSDALELKCSHGDTRTLGGGVFTPEQLDEYQDCTFFTRKDILRLYKRFQSLNPSKIPTNMQGSIPSTVTLSPDEIERMPELRENPFRKRICLAFSSGKEGNLTFDEFLDMFSVLSEAAPLNLKLHYAFKIYDFDDDGFIGKSDLQEVVSLITSEDINEDDITFIIDRIFEEGDLDMDQKLSFAEFEHVVSRSPDFVRTFHVRIG